MTTHTDWNDLSSAPMFSEHCHMLCLAQCLVHSMHSMNMCIIKDLASFLDHRNHVFYLEGSIKINTLSIFYTIIDIVPLENTHIHC